MRQNEQTAPTPGPYGLKPANPESDDGAVWHNANGRYDKFGHRVEYAPALASENARLRIAVDELLCYPAGHAPGCAVDSQGCACNCQTYNARKRARESLGQEG